MAICKRKLEQYIPKSIKNIQDIIPHKVSRYYEKYPFEEYDTIIKRKLRYYGVKCYKTEYQDCYDAAMWGYMYSIHRCALGSYDYTEAYIRKMISLCIIMGLNIANEDRFLCKSNNFRQIQLDKEELMNKY